VGIAVSLVMTGVFLDRYVINPQPASAEDNVYLLAQTTKKTPDKNNSWIVKIDNTTLSLDEFEREFKVHVYSLPIDDSKRNQYKNSSQNRKKFLTNLINEYLIYKKALQEGIDKRQAVQDLVKAVERRAIIQVYLNEKIEPKLNEVSDEQIEAIYNQNKKMFAGVDIDVARQQIKMQLLQRQYNDYLNDIVDELKGEAKVIKNENIEL
jgi:predicted small secreted protein